MDDWDYIIVGAGSSGCAVTWELANRLPNARILLLEAGPRDRSPFIHVPAGQIVAVQKHDWGYRTEPDPTRLDVAELWPRGKVLGGSSSINGTMYVRGAPSDFDRWAEMMGTAGESWKAEQVAKLFDAIERGSSTYSERQAPLPIRPVRHPHRVTKAFVRAATAVGMRFNDNYNQGEQDGVGYAWMTQRLGLRASAATAFLKPLRNRRNVQIQSGATVDRIDIDGGRARRVHYRRAGRTQIARGRHVVLSAGAIATPKLLMLSGIGEAEMLAAHGVTPLIDRPQVGRNLREHPLVRLTYRMRVPSYSLTEGLWQKLLIGLRYLAGREGPLANIFEATAFLRSDPAQPVPDLQLHFMPIGYTKRADGLYGFAPYRSVTVLLNASHPRSTGRICLASADPDAAPRIECQLLSDPRDVEVLMHGIGRVRAIMRTAPMTALIDEETVPGGDVEGTAALDAFLRAHTGIAYHPAGTCRMGIDADAVVDPSLRLRGVGNLWIADASIMPDLISGNTNAACMMIGTKLGRELAERDTR